MLGKNPLRLGRRKIDALVVGCVSVIAGIGVGLRTSAGEAAVVANAVGPSVTYLSAAVAKTPASAKSAPRAPARVGGLPNLDNDRVDSWVKRFTTSQRGSYATYLRRMSKYNQMISAKLAKKDMPQGLIYLAMIESGFNPTAKSRVAATGLWQFMSATGREYGLKITRRMDERKHPARSTDAALAYLSDLHDRFGSWYLAAAAYNTGQGRVARVLKQVTGKTKGTDADFYRIASRLPLETREYVPKLIAAARIGANPQRYGFGAD